MLDNLRRLGTDHQWLETKKAAGGFPEDLWKSVGGLANTGGGLVLLGVEEATGFTVTGLPNPGVAAATLQQLCETAEPPLRARITVIDHPDGRVVVARIPCVGPTSRPCHFPRKGTMAETSFQRLHDGDVTYTAVEIAHLLDAQQAPDHSRRLAPVGSQLDSRRVAAFEATLQEEDRDGALDRFSAVQDGAPTIAGWLTLGRNPADLSPLARVSCLSAPRAHDPLGAEQRGKNLEGTVGDLLDGVLLWMADTLGTVQVSRDGRLFDELDFPRGALRELISNALVHRSYRAADESTMISVRASDLIVITNPGGVHPGVDPTKLGLSQMSTPRNYALVRLCERIVMPDGARVVESLASGLPRADRLCYQAECLPPLFVVGPAQFSSVCIRGTLDLAGTALLWPALVGDAQKIRLLAAVRRIEELAESDPSSILHGVRVDVTLAARILGTTVLEHAAVVLDALRAAGALIERTGFSQPHWTLTPAGSPSASASATTTTTTTTKAAKTRRPHNETIQLILQALARDGEMSRAELEEVAGIGRAATTNVLKTALTKDLIEATTTNVHDMRRKYKLTANGRRQLRK